MSFRTALARPIMGEPERRAVNAMFESGWAARDPQIAASVAQFAVDIFRLQRATEAAARR